MRTDIQALRGLAILLVLLYHSGLLESLQAGYLGVDVFFVVSGYLITGIVLRGVKAGTFSFTEFYARRAKRLLPAAYVTFVATAWASAFFLTRPEMRDFTWQLLGAVTFTGNIVLWMQTGYFEGAAHLKPLLHVWSLSIEEQYYLLLPATLVFTPRRFWRAGVLVVVVGSLVLCLMLVAVKPGATFYLLPTRAWEMALGSAGIMILEGSVAAGVWSARLFWPAVAALLVVPFFPTGMPHPGVDALIVCSATLVVILRRHPALSAGLPAITLARLGDISYSLYLVHWPLLAFAANAWLSPPPVGARLGLVVLALMLATALYHWVEQPARRAEIPLERATFAMTLGASSAVVLLGFMISHIESTGDLVDYTYVMRGNIGLSPSCEYGETYIPKAECRTSDTPSILIWGDSNAMHLVAGIAATTDLGLEQATKSTCGPLLSISHFRTDDFYNRNWGLGCLRFSGTVLDYLASADSIQVVVLSSSFGQYLAGNQVLVAPFSFQTGETHPEPVEMTGSEDLALKSLLSTIAAIRALAKRVVLVAPPPVSSFDVGRCLERKALGKLTFGGDDESCVIAEDEYRERRSGVLRLLARAANEGDVAVFNLDEYLCHEGACAVELNGTFIYRDGGHLSYEGSRLLGQKTDLTNRLLRLAR